MKIKKSALICSAVGLLGVMILGGCGSNKNNNNGVQTFSQVDRLADPAVNELFATVANNRHQVNDTDNPTDDPGQLANDIQSFMTTAAGRSQPITDVVKRVLVPDVMLADLSQQSQASYLAVETNGATGGTFGGRKLTDDVIDTSLGIVFGSTVPSLGLATDDGREITGLTSDGVGPNAKHYLPSTFPYLGPPQ